MMKKVVFLLSLGCIFVSSAQALDVWNIYDGKPETLCSEVNLKGKVGLPELMENAICANPELKISYLSVLSSGAVYGQGLSDYLPSVNGATGISTKNDKLDAGESADTSKVSASAELAWLLLDVGGRSASADRLKALLDSAYFSYDNTLQKLLYDVASVYYATLSAEEKYEGLKKSEESYKKSYEEASSRFKLGLVPLSDKLQAQTSYDQARLASNVARKNIAVQLGNLAVLLDMSPDTHFQLKRPKKDISDSRDVGAFDALVKKALAQRPDYQASQKDVFAAEKQITIAKSDALPYLSVKASAGTGKDIRDGNRAEYTSSAGLTLTVPLFTGFSNSYKIGQAEFDYQQSLKNLEKVKNTIENEIWSAVQDYQTSLESFKISKSLLASAEENEKVAFASYKVGKVNILTLLDAQASLASARIENSTTFYNFLTAKANLQKVLGQMERIK